MYVLRPSDLNPPQYEAVTHGSGPLLVLAGAGSGKTRVIAHRIAYSVSRGITPESIVAVSFTNKAATEMRERVAALIGPELARACNVSTFHALGAQILRRDIGRLGYRVPFAIFDTTDQKGVIRELLRELRLDGSRLDLDALLSMISRAKLAMCDPERLPGMRYNPMRGILSKVYSRYLSGLRAYNAVDFDDLINLPVRLFQQHPDVLARYHDEWHYFMVDEYQDTNHTQFLLLQALAAAHHNVVVVGDDDQSIYGFRGAVADHILSFEAHFPGARMVSLEQNYRCTRTILEAANAVIAQNEKRRAKTLWTDGGLGEKLRYVQCRDEHEEASFVADAIGRLHAERHVRLRDIAILYRINPQSRAFEEALQEQGLAYRIVGGTKFYDRKEVRDVLHYLRACFNPHDDLALRRIVNVPPRGAGSTLLEQVGQLAVRGGISFYTALQRTLEEDGDLAPRTRTRLTELVELLERYRGRLRGTPGQGAATVRELIAETGYLDHLRSTRGKEEVILRRVDNVLEVVNAIADFERHHPDGSLTGFMERVAMEPQEPKNAKGDRDELVLMTLHSAKGLEFPVVFLVGFEEGMLPHARALTERGGVEEERRLCYVGITRAKQLLTLSGCRSRLRHGVSFDCEPSRFLEDIPASTLERSTDGASDAAKSLATIQQNRDTNRLAALRAAIFKG